MNHLLGKRSSIMKIFVIVLMMMAFSWGSSLDDLISTAGEKRGGLEETAASFLVDFMPSEDKGSVTAAFLISNLTLAFDAQAKFRWAKNIPNEISLNEVLPYAVFDEARAPWRADFLDRARPLVKIAKTASEAAQILNREFFKLIDVHYNTARKAPNQSLKEFLS